MRILILGGDGYLGWPTGLTLSAQGAKVKLVDNFFRRDTIERLNVPPLFPTSDMHERANVWHRLSGIKIDTETGDATNYDYLKKTLEEFRPDAIIHFAEQPSAPYSMMGIDEAQFTLTNNLLSTLNLAYAVKETNPEIHIIKLGTMGEYGTPNIDIEEGFLQITHKGREDRFLFPRQAGSLYHTTKIQDTDLLFFYVRLAGLRVTDLMQGPVYGFLVPEMQDDANLSTVFNYDAIFGTVLNRFMVQAVAGFPLTVYGKGGQKRGYLNLIDTVQCIRLSLDAPAQAGELRILNQFTEVYTIGELADAVISSAGTLGIRATKENIENPRLEAEEHYYNPVHTKLFDLGLSPTLLSDDTIGPMLEKISERKGQIQQEIIAPNCQWC